MIVTFTVEVPTTTLPLGGLLGRLYTLAKIPMFVPQAVPVVVARPEEPGVLKSMTCGESEDHF